VDGRRSVTSRVLVVVVVSPRTFVEYALVRNDRLKEPRALAADGGGRRYRFGPRTTFPKAWSFPDEQARWVSRVRAF